MSPRARRELAIVAGFVAAAAFAFGAKAYHIDEPFFLAIGRHILADPLHPFAFEFNWYGRAVPMASINNTPPTLGYLLAAAYALTGGGERAMRLFFLPFDLAAGLSLYLLAARFLRRPLAPALIAIAGPAYLINMNHLMAEKPMAAFAFTSLYALTRGVDDRRWAWYWFSAALVGAALLSKYNAIFLLLPAFGYGWERGVPPRKIAAYFLIAGSGLALYLTVNALSRGGALESAWGVTSSSADMWWSTRSHKLRSMLAFTGGCGIVTAVWPLFAYGRRWKNGFLVPIVCVAASALLFLPVLDLAPVVRPVDRWMGFVLSAATLYGLWGLFCSGERGRGWALWAPWALSVSLILLCLYWSVVARLVLFLLPPLVFALAEALESRWGDGDLRRLYAVSFAGVLGLSLCLSVVDYRYAAEQKVFARSVAARYPGRTIWCAVHWGLQYYIEDAGGKELDWSRGGWGRVRPGDIVIVTRVNANVLRPEHPLKVNLTERRLGTPIPLRLISGWDGEGGFYSNMSGFLPYSLSAEPLEEFRVLEAL